MTNAEFSRFNADAYDRTNGIACEHLSLENSYAGITISTIRLPYLLPTKMDKGRLQMAMDQISRGVTSKGATVDMRGVVKSGDWIVARTGAVFPDANYCIVYQVLLPPGYVLVINGATTKSNKAELMHDIESAISKMTYQ